MRGGEEEGSGDSLYEACLRALERERELPLESWEVDWRVAGEAELERAAEEFREGRVVNSGRGRGDG